MGFGLKVICLKVVVGMGCFGYLSLLLGLFVGYDEWILVCVLFIWKQEVKSDFDKM